MQVMQRVNGINKTLLNQVTRYKAEVARRADAPRQAAEDRPRPAGGIGRGQGARCPSGRRPAEGLHQQPQGVDPEDHQRAGGRRASAPPRRPRAGDRHRHHHATSRPRRRARSAARRLRSPSSTWASPMSGAARARRASTARARDVRLRPARRVAPAQRGGPVCRCCRSPAERSAARRPGLLQRRLPRRDLRRQRHDDPRARTRARSCSSAASTARARSPARPASPADRLRR